jgi:hypothetical protein
VFTRSGGVWTQQAYVKASNTNYSGLFGYYVALEGDTLAVGAPFEASNATGINGDQNNNNAPNSGAVYVFTRTAGIWTQQAYIKASNTDAGDRFGGDLALNGDTLAVGARLEAANGVNADQTNNSAPGAGAVYVFTRTAGVWSQQAYLKSIHAEANQNFSGSIALGADILAVGARLEDSGSTGINGPQANHSAPDSGAVYVFRRNGGVWDFTDYLKASNTDAGDQFGIDVAISDKTLVVGASLEASNATGVNGNQADNSAPNSGAVYVFDGL